MIYDLAIVGGGPAGLSAAVTAKNRNLSTILFDPGSFGLALQKASHITNYLGFPDISGKALMQAFLDHAKKAGTEIVSEKILSIMNLDGHFYLATPSGVTEAKTVILALGIPRSAQLMGEADLVGTGISYCATCDGNFYRNRPIGVICTVPAQWHEVEFLAGLASQVTAYVTFDVEGPVPDNVTVRKDRPKRIAKDGQDLVLQADDTQRMDGLFILRESDPVSRLLPDLAMEGNAIKVNEHLETNIPGVYAAGDCIGQPLQISKATGDGLVAVFGAADYLRKKG